MDLRIARPRPGRMALAIAAAAATVPLLGAVPADAVDPGLPHGGEGKVSPTPVDVSKHGRKVTARLRAQDDKGVTSVVFESPFGRAHRVSGNARDGIWEATVVIGKGHEPGKIHVTADITDTDARIGHVDLGNALVVKGPKVVQKHGIDGVKLSAHELDVRTAAKRIRIDFHAWNSATMSSRLTTVCVDPSLVFMGNSRSICGKAKKVSGTARDGRWRTTLTVPKKALSGSWCVRVDVRTTADYLGKLWASPTCYVTRVVRGGGRTPEFSQLPGGDFTVVGKGTGDFEAPRLLAARVEDTVLPRGGNLVFHIHATGDKGISQLLLMSRTGGNDYGFGPGKLESGTTRDGWWLISFHVDPESKPKTYAFRQFIVWDRWHARSWTTPASGLGAKDCENAFPAGALTTADGKAWDGRFTVT